MGCLQIANETNKGRPLDLTPRIDKYVLSGYVGIGMDRLQHPVGVLANSASAATAAEPLRTGKSTPPTRPWAIPCLGLVSAQGGDAQGRGCACSRDIAAHAA